MSPVTHFLIGWVAGAAAGLERRERVLVAIAGVAPDADGLGIVPELLTRNSSHPLPWFSEYHHVLFHNLTFALALTLLFALLARRQRWKAAAMTLVSVHLHLFCDLIGARGPDGYQWPIPYFAPFSPHEFSWSGQWALNSWQNLVITLVATGICFWFAIARRCSPVEVFSARADAAFVQALRQRFAAS